jgi:glucose/arabinose dehydrogenase
MAFGWYSGYWHERVSFRHEYPMQVLKVVHRPPAASERAPRRRTWWRWILLALVLLGVGFLGALKSGKVDLRVVGQYPAAAAISNQVGAGVTLQPVLRGLNSPLFLTHTGDGSGDLYILEKPGRIRVAHEGVVRPEPFVDLTDRVGSGGSEQGLLGLAFHPDYVSNGYFYVNYTDRNGDTVIDRYTANEDRTRADPATQKTIFGFAQPYPNHNGGMLSFGPDRMLWIGAGDGGSGGDPQRNGQNVNAVLGKLLRLDVDGGDPYGIPSDNPFVGTGNGLPELWAYGLRNPWRFSFDRATGDLYIGDVGQNAYEEINFTAAGEPGGQNYGWNRMEASHCFPIGSQCDSAGLVLPIAEYPTGGEGCSVTGGYVYRGSAFPAWNGTYFFTDYCSGTVWTLTRDGNGDWTRTAVVPAPGGLAGYSSFGEDEAGELYITDLDSGVIYHLVATS